MMTPLVWMAMKYQTSWNSYLGAFPIEWDTKHSRFKFESSVWKLKWFYWCVTVFLLIFNVGACTLILIRRYMYPTDNFLVLLYVLFPLVIGTMLLAISLGVCAVLYGNREVAALNAQLDILERLEDQNGKVRRSRHINKYDFQGVIRKVIANMRKPDGKLDIVGLCLMTFVAYGPILPPLITVSSIAIHIDPWYWLALDFLGKEVMSLSSVRIVLAVTCGVILYINAAQSVRLLQVTITFFIHPNLLSTEILHQLEVAYGKCRKPKDHVRHIMLYDQLLLANNFVRNVKAEEHAVCLTIGLTVGVMCLFTVLKLWHVVPAIGLLGASVGFLTLVVQMDLNINGVARMTELSSESLRSWRNRFGPKNRYLVRKYQVLQPLSFYAGIGGLKCFDFDRSFSVNFLMTIVDQTINLMMAIDEETERKFATAATNIFHI